MSLVVCVPFGFPKKPNPEDGPDSKKKPHPPKVGSCGTPPRCCTWVFKVSKGQASENIAERDLVKQVLDYMYHSIGTLLGKQAVKREWGGERREVPTVATREASHRAHWNWGFDKGPPEARSRRHSRR